MYYPKNFSYPWLKFFSFERDISSAEEVGRVGSVQLKHYERTNDVGLAGVMIKDLSEMFPEAGAVVPSVVELLWLYSKYKDIPGIGGWNGFMEEVNRGKPYQTTFIGCHPFINAPPTHYDTIYTALLSGAQKTKSLGQVVELLQSNQPLYFIE